MAESGHVAAKGEQTASAGKIQMLDLAALKERMGAKWERMAVPVQQFFEAAIRRNLGAGDIFYRSGELSYLMVFRGLSTAETELKCAAISEEVCQRLFGQNGESITMRNLIGHMDLTDLPGDAGQVAGLDVRLERDGQEILITRTAAGTAARNRPASAERELRVRLVNRDSGLQRIKAGEIAFAYRPIWDSAKHAVLTYLCQPAVGPLKPDDDLPAAYFAVEDTEDTAFLDMLVLEQCLQHARSLHASGLRIVFAVPVHFSTLSRMRNWEAYSAICRQIPKDISRDLAFIVLGIDAGVPHIRLVQEIPKLSLCAHRVLCAVGDVQAAGARFARTGAHGIGVLLARHLSETQISRLVCDIAREAQVAAIDSFVLNVPSTSIVLGAIDAGIRYLEGPVVKPAVSDPRHAFAQGVEELYRTRLRRP